MNTTETKTESEMQKLAKDPNYISIHPKHSLLIQKIAARTNSYVVGPTGSGKTAGIKLAAKENGLAFYKKLMGNQTSEASIIGYMDAGGRYVEGIAYKAFTEGGVLCLDEIDNGNPNTTLVANGLADREFAFPCGMREAHKDFILVATANTMGTGANIQYCGRNRLDMAMLNRFEFIQWDYDDKLEELIMYRNALTHNPQIDLGKIRSLYLDVYFFRKAIEELQLQHIVSPRNAVQATIAFVLGQSASDIFHTILLKGLDKETKKKVYELSQAKRRELKDQVEDSMFKTEKVTNAVVDLLKLVGDKTPDELSRLISIVKEQELKKQRVNQSYKSSF